MKKICKICGEEFEPNSGAQLYCKNCAPYPADSPEYYKWWRETFPERAKEGKLRWWKDLSPERKEDYKSKMRVGRRERRARIQEMWGRLGGITKEYFRPAEKYALKALEREGYVNIVNLNDIFPSANFDIKAEKNGASYVFQVTCRTHIGDIKRHKRFAEVFGVNYTVIYVKPDLSGYIITTKNEISEEMLEEVKLI